MGYEVGMGLFVVLVIGLLILFRKLARKNKFFRRFWNDNMKFSSHLPFGSIFARFIIADSDEEKAEKEMYLKIGQQTDTFIGGALDSLAGKQRAQRNREEAIRAKLAQQGLTAVSINGDGTFATAKDRQGKQYNVHISEG